MSQQSSKAWYKKHVKDPFVRQANAEQKRARSVYKLEAIQKKFGIIQSRMNVLDVGCAPGSWMQFAAQNVGPKGTVVGIDVLPIIPVSKCVFVQGDFSDPEIQTELLEHLKGKVDVVLSDLSPNMTGHPQTDQYAAAVFWEDILNFCRLHLDSEGCLVIKVFHGVAFEGFFKEMKKVFCAVKSIKPEASRQVSKEVYLIGMKKRISG
ncbi:MAG TPA: RlmE family RNA methyltransferase [Gammaproteobacteria bacterium]|nr:RlmE family RNA methyltransferase [Gammaproteobacteria bacterium]